MNPYDREFFNRLRHGSRRSAEVIVPLILEWVSPKSVVDVGCGDGTWLSVFQARGVDDILGLDGSYVQTQFLQIPRENFIPCDLSLLEAADGTISQTISRDRRFDLAVSLEVAEHLPAASARRFVESLVHLSDVVLFSAAIPHQGGTNHINEQWPDYWSERFKALGYILIDGLRQRIWDCPEVEPWYAQNSLLFVRGDRLGNYPRLQQQLTQIPRAGQAIVHPTIYLQHCPQSLSESSTDDFNPHLTQVIQILGVTLYPSTEIQSGEGLTIEISYQIAMTLAGAIVNLSISDEAGKIYLDTESEINPLPEKLSVTHSIQLQLERLDLVRGTYFINPGIFSLDWKQTYDFHWHRYPLTIEASVPQKGLVHPPMRWHHLVKNDR